MISCAAVTDVEACELCVGINDKEVGAVNSAYQSNDMAESLYDGQPMEWNQVAHVRTR